jgi:hypothetical protein
MILKFALITCLFYLSLSLVIEAVLFLLVSRREDLIFGATGWTLRTLFFAVWVLSFILATHFSFGVHKR